MNASTDAPLVFTVAEAAERLRITRPTIQKLFASGALASFKIGRRRLVPADAVDTFIAAQVAQSA